MHSKKPSENNNFRMKGYFFGGGSKISLINQSFNQGQLHIKRISAPLLFVPYILG